MLLTGRSVCNLTVIVAGLLLLAGCGGDALGRKAISGTVNLDDAPLAKGNVRFEPLQAENPTTGGAVIRKGKFQLSREHGLPPGSYRVSISCPKMPSAVDQNADAGGLAEELVPARYNTESTLQATVTANGANHFEFDLSTEQPAS